LRSDTMPLGYTIITGPRASELRGSLSS
jgi:hypothetical protein